MQDQLDRLVSAEKMHLHIDTTPLMEMMRGIAQIVAEQSRTIAALQRELEETRTAHSEALRNVQDQFYSRLQYTCDHVAAAMDAVRRETSETCQRLLPDPHAIPALADRVRRLEDSAETQAEINAMRNAEQAAVHSQLTSLRPSAFHNSFHAKSLESTVGDLRRDVDDLIRLLDIPQVFASGSQRSMTTTSLHRAANAATQEERVKFLHSLPSFHVLWTEVFRLSEKVSNGERRSPQRLRGTTSSLASLTGATASPVSKSSSNSGGGATTVFIAPLQIDVQATVAASSSIAGGRAGGASVGAVVVRVTRGGCGDVSGLVAGDTIVGLDGVQLAGGFHLLDLVNELMRDPSTAACELAVVPSGRTQAVPVAVRIALRR